MRFEFYQEAQYLPYGIDPDDPLQTKGEPRYVNVEYVSIQIDKQSKVVSKVSSYLQRIERMRHLRAMGEISDSEMENLEQFEADYEAYKNGTLEERQGTPLSEFVQFTKADIAMLNDKKIYTLEQLGTLSDAQTENVGFGAMNLREKARIFIEKNTECEAISKVANQNELLSRQVKELQEQLTELAAEKKQQESLILAEAQSKKTK